MKIFLGSDHAGMDLKRQVKDFLHRSGHEVIDEGDDRLNPQDDFPVFAARVVNGMKSSDDAEPLGILICGSGQGMCMAANRFKGIRAALCWNVREAHAARNDDNCNILCLSGRSTSLKEAEAIISTWLNTPFAGASRFVRRLKELDEIT